MSKDSTNELNEVLFFSILTELINHIIRNGGRVSQKNAINGYSGSPSAKESEIRSTIEWGITNGYLNRDLKTPRDQSLLSLTSEEVKKEFSNEVDIVISIPLLTELGLGRIKTRNVMLGTRETFRRVIENAQNILRISSPFLQESIRDKDGLPEIEDLFIGAFERGCEIRVLSRELFLRRSSEVDWLKKFAINKGFPNLLKIYDYHFEVKHRRRIISSTHAKMLISDTSMAYVGSGELRKNSLNHNFEIGCLVRGPIVAGLCEAFDLITRYAKEWYNDD